MALISKLESIGNAIREKTGKTELLTLDQMPIEIAAIETGGGGVEPPEEAFLSTGDCSYKFAYGNWDWFLKEYGKKMTTEGLTSTKYMFQDSNVEELPFDFNFDNSTYRDVSNMFYDCEKLKRIGKIINLYPTTMTNLFSYCEMLRELPEFVNINFDRIHTYASANISGMFNRCRSLRRVPEEFLKELWGIQNSYSYAFTYNGFYGCKVLDEVRGISATHKAVTSNSFYYTFHNCFRLKDIIFTTQNAIALKNQTIDLTQSVGYYNYSTDSWSESSIKNAIDSSEICNYNSGITPDKAIYDEATYAALKDDPDAFCLNNSTNECAYSRYNHDSAVNTINSLPDVSSGSGNTIKFTGAAGSATDGGAINTLTEEEIAVAAAKGWTVTLV